MKCEKCGEEMILDEELLCKKCGCVVVLDAEDIIFSFSVLDILSLFFAKKLD